PDHYFACVTSNTGEPRTIDLGLASDIDSLIKNLSTAQQNAQHAVAHLGEPRAEHQIGQALDALASRLLKPIAKEIDIAAAQQWLISPDSNLWLVPWAALRADDGSYIVEKHSIQLLVSGRDLLLNPLQLDRQPGVPIVVANPDFDMDPSS